jgi:hypothetical protein
MIAAIFMFSGLRIAIAIHFRSRIEPVAVGPKLPELNLGY